MQTYFYLKCLMKNYNMSAKYLGSFCFRIALEEKAHLYFESICLSASIYIITLIERDV